MFLHLSVILFTRGVSVTPGQTPPAQTPLGQTPLLVRHHPWADTPWVDTPLPSACWDTHPLPSACWDTHPLPSACWDTHPSLPRACWDTVNKWAVRILLECILVRDDSFTDTWERYLDLFFHLKTFTRLRSYFHVLNTDNAALIPVTTSQAWKPKYPLG